MLFSCKTLLATEQRIPGLGNGSLQDILFNGGIHPKRKKSTLTDFEKGELFHSLKVTLNSMTENGGRDTENDLSETLSDTGHFITGFITKTSKTSRT